MGNKFPKSKSTVVSIPMQKYYLITKYRKILLKDNSSKRIDMDFLIKSTNTNMEYTIKIKYDNLYKMPNVFLLKDNLPTRLDENIPHIYGTSTIRGKEYLKLCTFYPGEDWNNKMILATTVFLWAIEWIYFYELWIVSGQWCGRRNPSRRRKKRRRI